LSFCRRKGSSIIIVTVMLKNENIGESHMQTGMDEWKDTAIKIPPGYSGSYRDIFTGKFFSDAESLKVGEMFSQFPFSVIIREDDTSV